MDFFIRLILLLYSVGLIFVLFSFKSLRTVLSLSASKSDHLFKGFFDKDG